MSVQKLTRCSTASSANKAQDDVPSQQDSQRVAANLFMAWR